MQDTDKGATAQVQSPKRRYLALLARAKDQAGKPEGELCRKLADQMATRWPDLLDVDEVQPVQMFEFRWKKWHERELLVHSIRYFGCLPQCWAGRRAQTKVVLVTTDAATRDLIEHAYETQRERLWKVIEWAMGGYFSGAMPIPRDGVRDEDDSDDDHDPELLALALAAMRLGRNGQPILALQEGS